MQAMTYAILMEYPCRKWICTYFYPIINVCILLFFLNIDMYIFDKIKLTFIK